jgi:hypothetical protein
VGGSSLNELIVDLLVNESAGSSAAALTSVEEQTEVSLLDGEVDVSVVHDDVGGLTTELEGDSLEVVGVGVTHNVISDFGRSGEGNLVDITMLSELRSAAALTGEDVDDTLGESSFVGDLSHAEGREGSLLSNLGDGDTSCGEGGSPLPGSHEGGEVPGDNLGGNTNGLVLVVLEVRSVNWDNISEVLISPASVGSELTDDKVDISSLGNADVLTVVEGFEGSKLISVLLKEISEAVHQLGSLVTGGSRPGSVVEGVSRGFNSSVDILFSSLGDLSDESLSSRVVGTESLSTSSVDKLSVDVHLVLESGGGLGKRESSSSKGSGKHIYN